MSNVDRETKRNLKIARTLIRLKHSLAADDEIEEYREQVQEALKGGVVARVTTDLQELLGS